MTETVGSKLLSEIERVSAKRARWRLYAEEANPQANFAPSIYMITFAIEEAKAALQSDDPARAIRALHELKGYSNDD